MKSAGERNEMNIISNIEDYRGIDIKAGDSDDDKTVIASNTWEEHAMYAGRDGHYEEFEQYDSWNDGYSRPDGEWDESWAENDPEPPMYEEYQYQCPPPPDYQNMNEDEERWQPEYTCNEQGYSRDTRHEYVPEMPQPTIEMESNIWQPNWSNAQYAGQGAAWQTICKQPWVQQTRRMSRDDRYTPENMAKTRIPPEFAGILLNNADLPIL